MKLFRVWSLSLSTLNKPKKGEKLNIKILTYRISIKIKGKKKELKKDSELP